jgi:hypothetical protein
LRQKRSARDDFLGTKGFGLLLMLEAEVKRGGGFLGFVGRVRYSLSRQKRSARGDFLGFAWICLRICWFKWLE